MRNPLQRKRSSISEMARVPYGSKSKKPSVVIQQIVRIQKEDQDVRPLCQLNTASVALETISAETDLPMIGLVEP